VHVTSHVTSHMHATVPTSSHSTCIPLFIMPTSAAIELPWKTISVGKNIFHADGQECLVNCDMRWELFR
jgi:hypothetical protein